MHTGVERKYKAIAVYCMYVFLSRY